MLKGRIKGKKNSDKHYLRMLQKMSSNKQKQEDSKKDFQTRLINKED